MVNSNKIRARIIEVGKTIAKISGDMNMTPYTLGRKISNQSDMTLNEANKLQQLLDISDADFNAYFFV